LLHFNLITASTLKKVIAIKPLEASFEATVHYFIHLEKGFTFKCTIINLLSIEVLKTTTLYPFNTNANRLTEEEFERRKDVYRES